MQRKKLFMLHVERSKIEIETLSWFTLYVPIIRPPHQGGNRPRKVVLAHT